MLALVLELFGRYKTICFWKKGSICQQNSVITHYAISCNILLYHDTEEVIYQYTQNVYRCISSAKCFILCIARARPCFNCFKEFTL